MVIVDDFFRVSWVILPQQKLEAFEQSRVLFKKIQNEKGYFIKRIRSDHGKEFENVSFADFCEENGIMQEFYPNESSTEWSGWKKESSNPGNGSILDAL
jgi:hypothetical protein